VIYALPGSAALLLAVATATGHGRAGAAGLLLIGVLVAVQFGLARRPGRWAPSAASLPLLAWAVLLILQGPQAPGLQAAGGAFFLAAAVLAGGAFFVNRAPRAALSTAISILAALACGDLAQPATPPGADLRPGRSPIPWAPSLHWEIDRLTNYYADKTDLPSVPVVGEVVTTKKPVGQFRVVVIGSSPVIGAGVDNPAATFPKVAEARLRELFPERDLRVLNAGIYGGDAAIWVYYRDIVRQLHPDLVVYFTGNIEDSAGVPRRVWRQLESIVADLPPDTALRRRAIAAGTGSRAWLPIKEAFLRTRTGRNLRHLLAERRDRGEILLLTEPADAAAQAEVRQIIAHFVDRTAADGARLILAPAPAPEGEFVSTFTARAFREAAAARYHVGYWDTRGIAAPADYADTSHPTAAGHRALGNALAAFLAERLPPTPTDR
jgi:lysophospholipase L1-like esterase